MVLTYDLFEDRCTIDVISRRKKNFFFKMAENFETLENILPHWTNEEIEAVDKLSRLLINSKRKKKKRHVSTWKMTRKNSGAISVARDKTKHKMGRKIISR